MRIPTANRALRALGLLLLGVGLGCGGSGSTGLGPLNSALEAERLGEARLAESCLLTDEAEYCAADPDVRAQGGEFSSPPQLPSNCAAPAEGSCTAVEYRFLVAGFDESGMCAVASRRAGGLEPWNVGPIESVRDGRIRLFIVPTPAPFDVETDQIEVAVLCFRNEPGDLPEDLEILADAGPDVIFVPPFIEIDLTEFPTVDPLEVRPRTTTETGSR